MYLVRVYSAKSYGKRQWNRVRKSEQDKHRAIENMEDKEEGRGTHATRVCKEAR